eukprot:TRINITY_DN2095_c0_g1_i1.p1 TRINITY_DN2095_c0_g1~~TRINITY_DN2095_c0_g1_i1.p1  ORF type:complete len:685 (+),score=166.24 TRINITY_DN2095_c0_g1_i1:59-2056(+)
MNARRLLHSGRSFSRAQIRNASNGGKLGLVNRPNTSNRIKMVQDGWDEYSQTNKLLKSVRKGKVIYDADLYQRRNETSRVYPDRAKKQQQEQQQQQQQQQAQQSTPAVVDPWRPDDNGVWYAAITKLPIDNEKYCVYPGNGKTVNQVLEEMGAGNLISWKPKRNRRTVVVLDSKWSGWHEVQWDGVVIKTIREKGSPHPENPDSIKDSPLESEYQAIRKKISESERERRFSELAKEESRSKHQPPRDDIEVDGKSLISLVNRSDSMVVRAYLVFKFMERKNIVGTATTFQSLLTACSNTCTLDLAINVWRMMLARGIQPDQGCYNTLISLASKSGNRAYAFKVFEEMEDFGLSPDRQTLVTLINADSERGFAIVKRYAAEGKSVPPSILLRMYCQQDADEKAFELFKSMQRERRPPGADDYNQLLLLCERKNNCEKALEIFNDMEERAVSPNFLTYNTIMNILATNKQVERLHKVQAMMHDRKVTTLIVLSTFRYKGRDTSIINGVNMDLSVSLDVPLFNGEEDEALCLLTQQMLQYLEYNSEYKPNFKGLPTYTLMHLARETNQRGSLSFHCEKKSLSYLLMKHGVNATSIPKPLPRVNVNARMCMDCHSVFATASKVFGVRLECNDNNLLHVFENGTDLSCSDGWRNLDANNTPGSGQFGGGL